MRDVNELDARAEALYDKEASWQEFATSFTREELDALWQLCLINPQEEQWGRSYDDEVYDARAWLDDGWKPAREES